MAGLDDPPAGHRRGRRIRYGRQPDSGRRRPNNHHKRHHTAHLHIGLVHHRFGRIRPLSSASRSILQSTSPPNSTYGSPARISDGVTLSNGTITANGTSSLTITLSSNSNRTAVAGLDDPPAGHRRGRRIRYGRQPDSGRRRPGHNGTRHHKTDVLVGLVHHRFGRIRPLSSASRSILQSTSPPNSTYGSPARISDGVTLSNGTITANGTSSLTITLSSNSNRTAVAGLDDPPAGHRGGRRIRYGRQPDSGRRRPNNHHKRHHTAHLHIGLVHHRFGRIRPLSSASRSILQSTSPPNSTYGSPARISDGVTLSNGTITTNGTSSLTITLSSNSNRTAVAGLDDPPAGHRRGRRIRYGRQPDSGRRRPNNHRKRHHTAHLHIGLVHHRFGRIRPLSSASR